MWMLLVYFGNRSLENQRNICQPTVLSISRTRARRYADGVKTMSLLKRRVAAALAVVGVASLVTFLQVEASHETDDQIGTEAVWNAADGDLTDISKVCKGPQSADYAKCFVEQMGGYASSDAVAFTQLMI